MKKINTKACPLMQKLVDIVLTVLIASIAFGSLVSVVVIMGAISRALN